MKGATECNNVSWVVKFQIFSTKVGLFLDKEFQNAFDFIMDISFNLMGEFFDKKDKILPQFKVLHTILLSNFVLTYIDCQKSRPKIETNL